MNMNSKPDKECEKRSDIILLSEIITNSIYWQMITGQKSVNLGLIFEHITGFLIFWIRNVSLKFRAFASHHILGYFFLNQEFQSDGVPLCCS